MRVSEIMTTHVHTVPPSLAVDQASELMRRKRIHHLVVMDGSSVTGVLSDRDTVRRGGAAQVQPTVADVMTTSVVTTTPAATIRRVANLMRGRTLGCVPVVNDGRLVGIVTVSDLLQLLGRGIDRPSRPARPNATHRVPHRKTNGGGFGRW